MKDIKRGEKPTRHIVFIGHSDHGKSTLLGRIFYDLGLIEEKTLERARKYAEIFGQKGFDFAY
ncbi:hypothetical protein J7J95_03670, partial [bacterium]|nr:hypothetical protein [bacterium]